MDTKPTWLGLDVQGWMSVLIATLLALAIAYTIYRLQKTPKTLDYAEFDPQRLGSNEELYPGLKLVVSWTPTDGNPEVASPINLLDAQINGYRFQNTGKRAIKGGDFQQPILISARKGRIIDGLINDVSHSGVCGEEDLHFFEEEPSGRRISIRPALVNPSDWFDVVVLTDGAAEGLEISCWLVEESRSMRRRQMLRLPAFRTEMIQEMRRSFITWTVAIYAAIYAVVTVSAAVAISTILFHLFH